MWAAVRPIGWELLITGPDECGHLAQARSLVHRLSLEEKVRFRGEVWGDPKLELFFSSDLFVLPSFSENFGLVIAEALACGVPVITTRATPWKDLEDYRCGWWIEVGVDPLIYALKSALAMPRRQLQEMGRRGYALVKRKYDWDRIGEQMVEVYQWILARGDVPDCVSRD